MAIELSKEEPMQAQTETQVIITTTPIKQRSPKKPDDECRVRNCHNKWVTECHNCDKKICKKHSVELQSWCGWNRIFCPSKQCEKEQRRG